MIPPIKIQGILPPYIGADPTNRDEMSPYWATMSEFVVRFATSGHRIDIIRGLLDYRLELMNNGFTGFQWLSGSFVEDIESLQNRHPNDVDVVSFINRPPAILDDALWFPFMSTPLAKRLFNAKDTKKNFLCDAYPVDMCEPVEVVVDNTRYWAGLFSHQRNTVLWKGMVAVELNYYEDSLARSLPQIQVAPVIPAVPIVAHQ